MRGFRHANWATFCRQWPKALRRFAQCDQSQGGRPRASRLKQLQEGRWEGVSILVIHIGCAALPLHMLSALRVGADGKKHIMGIEARRAGECRERQASPVSFSRS